MHNWVVRSLALRSVICSGAHHAHQNRVCSQLRGWANLFCNGDWYPHMGGAGIACPHNPTILLAMGFQGLMKWISLARCDSVQTKQGGGHCDTVPRQPRHQGVLVQAFDGATCEPGRAQRRAASGTGGCPVPLEFGCSGRRSVGRCGEGVPDQSAEPAAARFAARPQSLAKATQRSAHLRRINDGA
jgi:hypothetical protein